jgi:hypothetical protein
MIMTENSSGSESAEDKKQKLSRREFLKLSGLALLGLAFRRFPGATGLEALVETPKLEGVTFNFEFVNHTKENDIAGVRQEVDKNDLLVIENIGWTKEMEAFFNSVSKGDVSLEKIAETVRQPYYRQLLAEIRGSKKLVRFVDTPADSDLDKEWKTAQSVDYLDFSKRLGDQAIDLYQRFQKYADWQRKREGEILVNLAKTVESVKEDNGYANKEMKVMVIYGASHTRLMHILSQENKVGFQYPTTPFVFSYEDEAKRRFWFSEDTVDPKKVKNPDADLLAHVILERLIKNWFYFPNEKFFPDTSTLDQWVRGVASKFSVQDISALWEYQRTERRKKGAIPSIVLPELKNFLVDMMRNKGVEEKYIKAGL